MKKNTYAVIGLGQFGYAVAETLAKAGCEVLAVDRNSEKIQALSPYVTYPLCADVTDPGVLESLDFSHIDVAVIGFSDKMEASVVTTLFVKEAGVPYVMVKANGALHGQILKKVGADEIIFPEQVTGKRVAGNFISGGFQDFFELSDEVSIVEMPVLEKWVGKNLKELNLRQNHGLNVIALKENGQVSINIDPNSPLRTDQILGIVGTNAVLRKLKENS